MDEATFYPSGAPVEKPYTPPMAWQDKVVVIASVAALVALAIITRIWG